MRENGELVEYGEPLFRVEPGVSSIEFVDTTTRDGNQSLWSATGLTTPDVLAIAPTMDRVGLPRARLHVEHAHGGVGALPPRGPVGADPPGQRGDAEHAAGDDHDRHAVHLVDAGRTRR